MYVSCRSRACLSAFSLLCVFLLCVLCDSVVRLSSRAGEADRESPALPIANAPAPSNASRSRVPSPDVNQPIPLPILAQPLSDRASLEDPTTSASTAAALTAPMPPRTRKAPFVNRTLPDPYERRRTTISVPEEPIEIPLGSPQTPRR